MSTEQPPVASDPTMVNQTDAAARSGEQSRKPGLSSFESFYRAEHPSVLGLAFVLTGNHWVAEDTTQDAFTSAFRRWNIIASYDKPGAWVRRVVCNQAVSALRRRVREARAILRLSHRTADEIVLDEGDEAFWQAVRRLPARQAQAVALRYMEDYSVAEIASVLDCSEGTVKTHLSRARAAVAQELQLEDDQ